MFRVADGNLDNLSAFLTNRSVDVNRAQTGRAIPRSCSLWRPAAWTYTYTYIVITQVILEESENVDVNRAGTTFPSSPASSAWLFTRSEAVGYRTPFRDVKTFFGLLLTTEALTFITVRSSGILKLIYAISLMPVKEQILMTNIW